jgi:hypothetical protein
MVKRLLTIEVRQQKVNVKLVIKVALSVWDLTMISAYHALELIIYNIML